MGKKHICQLHKKKKIIHDNSTERGGYVEQTKGDDGYMHVKLYDDLGVEHDKLVHILVASTFLPNPNNYTNVLHIDGNKINNNCTNLRWIP